MAQYESGTQTLKVDMTNALASVLEVSPLALIVTDIYSEQGLLHTLFALEDLYGLKIEQAKKYKNGEITKNQYDEWRYNYPKFGNIQGFVKVPSKKIRDAMVDAFKDKLRNM